MRVLVVEDDPLIAKSLSLALYEQGMVSDITGSGEECIQYSKLGGYDAIVLDLKLPDIHGYEVLLRLRAAGIKIPVIILSGLSDADQKVKGLGLGADDYLTKPFNKPELIARIQAIIRRYRGYSDSVIKFGKVSINIDNRTVSVGNNTVHLTSKEYAILELLAMRRGTVLTKEMFLNHLYGGIDEPELKIIDVFVCKLRKKLAEAAGGVNYIETIWGRGYMLKENDEAEKINDVAAKKELDNVAQQAD